ncbi:hypothetical protein G9A89_011542 [Geosiphon pyriformis]|nr:hypothetical protein G9A89_011542 [Geosiphon pyriformis]
MTTNQIIQQQQIDFNNRGFNVENTQFPNLATNTSIAASSNQAIVPKTLPDIHVTFPTELKPADLIVKKKDGTIPTKPPNAFFIYRREYVKALKSNGFKFKQRHVSSMASQAWICESKATQNRYREIARDAAKVLAEMRKAALSSSNRDWKVFILPIGATAATPMKTPPPEAFAAPSVTKISREISEEIFSIKELKAIEINDEMEEEEYNDLGEIEMFFPSPPMVSFHDVNRFENECQSQSQMPFEGCSLVNGILNSFTADSSFSLRTPNQSPVLNSGLTLPFQSEDSSSSLSSFAYFSSEDDDDDDDDDDNQLCALQNPEVTINSAQTPNPIYEFGSLSDSFFSELPNNPESFGNFSSQLQLITPAQNEFQSLSTKLYETNQEGFELAETFDLAGFFTIQYSQTPTQNISEFSSIYDSLNFDCSDSFGYQDFDLQNFGSN